MNKIQLAAYLRANPKAVGRILNKMMEPLRAELKLLEDHEKNLEKRLEKLEYRLKGKEFQATHLFKGRQIKKYKNQ